MDLRRGKLRDPLCPTVYYASLYASPCLTPSLLQQVSFFVAHPPPRLPILHDMSPRKEKRERERDRSHFDSSCERFEPQPQCPVGKPTDN